MRLRTIVIVVVVVLALGAGLWWAFRPQPVGVDLAVIERGTLVVSIADEGMALIRDTYLVAMPVGGDVQRIPLRVGDRVEEGEVIATIVPQRSAFLDERSLAEAEAGVRAAQAAVDAAEAELTGAQAEFFFAQNDYDRVVRLLERGVATGREEEEARFQLSRREIQLENTKAALAMRERQLEQAEARLLQPEGDGAQGTRFEVRAPVSGQVLAIANESARSLAAGSELMTLGDPGNLGVVVDILSTDAVRISAGAPAIIDGWGQDTELDARVASIEPIGFTKVSALGIEEQRVRVHLDILSDPALWRSLGHRYRVFVRIETQRVEDAVLVPTAALFRNGPEWSVFSVDGGVARLRPLSLGLRDSALAEVLQGLNAGEQVILHPSDGIAEATRIEGRN